MSRSTTWLFSAFSVVCAVCANAQPLHVARPDDDRPVSNRLVQSRRGAAHLTPFFEPITEDAGRAGFVTRYANYKVHLDGETVTFAFPDSSSESGGGATADIAELSLANSSAVSGTGVEAIVGVSNYLLGRDPSRWRTRVPHFRAVRFGEVYPGIGVTYYINDGHLEYDFIVAPRADPSRIEWKIGGVTDLRYSSNGDLVARVGSRPIYLIRPRIYQSSGKRRAEIRGGYRLDRSRRRIRFWIGPYDHSRTLIIDPIIAAYSTYLGGSNEDGYPGAGIAVDAAGNTYLTGRTTSTDFPTKNPLQSSLRGSGNLFITKIDPTGSTLLYSTYLGGSGSDSSADLKVDAAGNVYVIGTTSSTDFPVTPGSVQPNCASPCSAGDAFLVKLDASGSRLIYSTYFGGSAADGAAGVDIDSAGNAVVIGLTLSPDLPVKSAVQPTLLKALCGTAQCAKTFIAKFNATGTNLVFSTYFGGSGADLPSQVAVGRSSGNIVAVGYTYSSDFPVLNAIQGYPAGGSCNGLPCSSAFISKLDPNGLLLFSTYLGGSTSFSGDTPYNGGDSVALDASENIYVAGTTYSLQFPTTPGTFRPKFGGCIDAFLSKLDPSGSTVIYSTYVGGEECDTTTLVAVDDAGNTYLAWATAAMGTSPEYFPLLQAIQPTFGGGFYDALIAKLNAYGTGLVYSTLAGGTGNDFPLAATVDAARNFYVAGMTEGGFPVTTGAVQTRFGGLPTDQFVLKISESAEAIAAVSTNSLDFRAQAVSSASAARELTILNSGTANLSISAITVTDDFVQNNTCTVPVPPAGSCKIQVTFAPHSAGAHNGSLTIQDNAPAAPHVVALSGTGLVQPSAVTPETGWWWDPKLNGTGFFIESGGNSGNGMFIGGFLYDAAGNATWLVSTGQMNGSKYSGTWLKVTGGQTLLGPYVAPSSTTPAGNVTIVFSTSTMAVMTRPDGTQINIQRFSFSSNPPVSPEPGTAQNGWWWAGQSLTGTGYGIEFQGDRVFIVAYVYDSAGQPVWYLATGRLTTANSYFGTWDVYAGGPELVSAEGTYSAHKASTAAQMNLYFTSATTAHLTVGTNIIRLQRFQSF